MMQEFLVHVRKDLKLLSSDSLVAVLLVSLTLLSIVSAFNATVHYSNAMRWYDFVVGEGSEDGAGRRALYDYWNTVLFFFTIIFLMVSAMAFTTEKESGMTRFIMTYHASKPISFLSKYLIMAMLAFATCMIATLAFAIVFSLMGVTGYSAKLLLASMVFPLLILLAYCAFGLLISTLSNKRALVIAIAVMLFLGGAMMNGAVKYEAEMDTVARHPGATYYNWTENVSFGYLV